MLETGESKMAKEKKEGKWFPGKKLAEAVKKARLKKAYKKEGMDKKAAKEKAAKKAKAPETGKIRKGVKGVESTKGGEYVKYDKKSKPAKSFREAFAKARKEKGAGKTFTWDGRSYSTNTADDVKKAKAEKKAAEKKAASEAIAKATSQEPKRPEYGAGGKVEGGGMFYGPATDAR